VVPSFSLSHAHKVEIFLAEHLRCASNTPRSQAWQKKLGKDSDQNSYKHNKRNHNPRKSIAKVNLVDDADATALSQISCSINN